MSTSRAGDFFQSADREKRNCENHFRDNTPLYLDMCGRAGRFGRAIMEFLKDGYDLNFRGLSKRPPFRVF